VRLLLHDEVDPAVEHGEQRQHLVDRLRVVRLIASPDWSRYVNAFLSGSRSMSRAQTLARVMKI